MEQLIRVFIADASAEFAALLSDALEQEEDFVIVGCVRRGDLALEQLRSCRADLLVTDLLLPGLDGLSLLRRLREEELLPHTLVVSGFCNDRIARIVSSFADNFLPKPCRTEDLLSQMRECVCGRGCSFVRQYDNAVYQALLAFGLQTHLDGFRFLRDGLLRTLDDRALLRGVTKSLYRDIARSCGTNAACVERSIRSAIEGGWARFTPEQRRQYFGSLFDACEKAPSNVPFLTAMTEFVEQQCCREERLGF